MLNVSLEAPKAPEKPLIAPPAVEPASKSTPRPYKLDCRYIKRHPQSLEPLEAHSPDLSIKRERMPHMYLPTSTPRHNHCRLFEEYRDPPSMTCTPEKPLPSPLSLHINRLMQTLDPMPDVQSACFGEKEDCSDPSTVQTPALSSRTGKGGCSCKKSRCLKLYCECFASQNGCSADCDCVGCFNRPEFEEITGIVRREVLDANPAAFEPKVGVRSHAKGCNCQRNLCQKKYCECFNAGVRCSALCRCAGCLNEKEAGVGSRVYKPIVKSRRVPLGLLVEKFKVLSRVAQLSYMPND